MLANFLFSISLSLYLSLAMGSIILHLLNRSKDQPNAIAKTQSSRKPKSRPRCQFLGLCSTPDPVFLKCKKIIENKNNVRDPFSAKISFPLPPLSLSCSCDILSTAQVRVRNLRWSFAGLRSLGRIDFLTAAARWRRGRRHRQKGLPSLTINCLTNSPIFFNFFWHFCRFFCHGFWPVNTDL